MATLDTLYSLGKSVARGVPQLATGFVDLAALPLTMTGVRKPEQIFGSTAYLTDKGLLPQPQTGLLNQGAELASSMVNPAAAAKGATVGLLGTFIGKGSKLWNAESNNIAKALEKEGVAPETIWSQTGNVKAPDGKWRQEISDIDSTVSQYPQEGNMFYLDKYSKELYNKPYGQLPFGEKGLGNQRETISKLADEEMKKYEKVGTTLTHPKLYESYPDLKNIDLQQWIGRREGSYYPQGLSNKEPNPYITVGAENPEQLKSTLLHELQHGIQMKEGFARGGNLESAASADVLPKLEEVRNKIKQLNIEPYKIENNIAAGYNVPKDTLDKYNKWQSLKEQEDKLISNRMSPFDAYKRLFGEAEARLTQSRLPLTQEQRLQYYPYAQGQYGLDVPYGELIVQGLLK
jgi:hypothetical protein